MSSKTIIPYTQEFNKAYDVSTINSKSMPCISVFPLLVICFFKVIYSTLVAYDAVIFFADWYAECKGSSLYPSVIFVIIFSPYLAAMGFNDALADIQA